MTKAQRLRLVHDVGKYVARTARNLPTQPTAEMVAMLVQDLFELRPGRRASSVLAELAADASDEPPLADARLLLAEADSLEAAVRRGEPAAVARAAALALRVERRLRALLEAT
ncbi:MAG TPA: hypothetical protein VIA18_18370 [Polyangia bacterium]|nr:hypothetical protein [Polyangia bacterium]